MVRSDTTPLVSPFTPQEIETLKQCRRRGNFGSPTSPWVKVGGVIVFVLTFGITVPKTWEVLVNTDSHENLMWLLRLPPILVIFTVLLLGLWAYLRQRQFWLLFAHFVDVSGMRFGIRSAEPQYPGLFFSEGRFRTSTLHLFPPIGVLADAGGYEYVTSSGRSRTIHHWCFVAFRLPHPVPHPLLDAKANNMQKLINLPKAPASSQCISLGEPFDSHYRPYTPEGYGRDALQLLPPNVMEALLNALAVYDIEIIDDWLFCYTQSQQGLTNPAAWRLLETIANGVPSLLTPIVNCYSDSHLPGQETAPAVYGPGTPAPVAPLGRYLRSGTSLGVILPVIGLIGLIGFFLFVQMTYMPAR